MMVTIPRIFLVALGFVVSATVNASPSMPTGEPEAQHADDCVAWYTPQLQTPPETCNDVVNMHPGLDLATFLKMNPMIHPYCDNMQLGQKVCIRAIQQNDCAQPANPSAQPANPSAQPANPSAHPQEPSPKRWETSTTPKPQGPSSIASPGWH
ncbi:uncharacterized protein N7498_009488 [Penicillium cinerascens]|uniref:LysM domain-containing protein n=1 Tax=Penicillium cinerascens TaxID=70096 RepID=A0A9W9J5L0_9EURO|nr:uncharacterized protein N7498_009488 [Penicillium cinerascens]KAJ5190503.1 hypothetical protein N7498_009488 [Penicillium cinerascens]